jgi:predicted small secreted protein
MGCIMRTRLVPTALATTAVALSLGLAGCSNTAAPDAQALRNDAAHELAAARQATLTLLTTQLDLLHRAELRARLAADQAKAHDVDQQIAAYTALAAAIQAAPTADSVRSVVDQAGIDLGGAAVPEALG